MLRLSNGEELTLDHSIVFKNGIHADSEISRAGLAAMKRESDFMKASNYAAYLLTGGGYSSGSIKTKLALKGFSQQIIDSVIRKLKRDGLLDDLRFAYEYTESLLRRKPAGRDYLVARLRKKYIPAVMAGQVVDELLKDLDETDMALQLLRSRRSYFSKFDLETARQKAYNYLSRRSIGYRAAKQAFERIIEEERQD